MFGGPRTAYEPAARSDLAAGGEPHLIKVLYLAHCTREKGLFDTLAGARLANLELVGRKAPVSLRLLGSIESASRVGFHRRPIWRAFATAAVRLRTSSFRKMRCKCPLVVPTVIDS